MTAASILAHARPRVGNLCIKAASSALRPSLTPCAALPRDYGPRASRQKTMLLRR